MKISYLGLLPGLGVTAMGLLNCDQDIEKVQTECTGNEMKIVLPECLLEKYSIYAPELFLSGIGEYIFNKCFVSHES